MQRLHTQKPGILGILLKTLPKLHPDAYSEPCHINENLGVFRTLTYLKPDTYLEASQRFKTEFFAKIVKNYNFFPKRSILDI